MSNTLIKFHVGGPSSLEASDPQKHPIVILGQLPHLNAVPYKVVQTKLEPRVSEEIYKLALENLNPTPTDSVPLYLNSASIAGLPKACSRHNTPSRAHSLTKMIKSSPIGGNGTSSSENILVVCEKASVFALACAVAKAFPLYSRKSSSVGVAKKGPRTVNVEFLTVSSDAAGEFKLDEGGLSANEIACLHDATKAVRNAARLTDTPANELHTDAFVEEAQRIGLELGITPVIIRGEELDQKGFGGIYGVGKASDHPPALVVLSHKPPGATKNIAWVGKGIVFDTGGLSIKSKTGMCSMKKDCGGAAAILNAFYLAVKQGFKENLHAILCLAENSVDSRSTRPDDVLTMYSKKTVEINNTDAEGRLVLADGVVYARNDLGAEVIVDMATLTGAQGVATGKYHAAVLTNSEQFETASTAAGKSCGELVFPLVFTPELHFSEFSSAVADMKNSAADRSNALSSCAGLFIMSHLGFDFPGVWVHFDIASPAEVGDRATGYGVALLNTLFGSMSSSDLLKAASPPKSC